LQYVYAALHNVNRCATGICSEPEMNVEFRTGSSIFPHPRPHDFGCLAEE
jgi:hypothetical protein